MTGVVADTHSLLWYLSGSNRLSTAAASRFEEVEANGSPIFVPAIVLVELRYLIEKGRSFEESDFEIIVQQLNSTDSVLTLAPIDLPVAEAVGKIPRSIVPEMPDRLIAATALSRNIPLISKDREINLLTNIDVIW